MVLSSLRSFIKKEILQLLPKTSLLQAPFDMKNTFGEGMTSDDLIKGLRIANPSISVPVPDAYGWYPGKALGMTSIWCGPPSEAGGRKICAFHLGMVPEFTQVDSEGELTRRGWRSIFQKVLRLKVISKARLEQVFKVNLSVGGKEKACSKCREENIINSNIKTSGLCDSHNAISEAVKLSKRIKAEAPLVEKYFKDKELKNPIHFS